MGLKARKKPDTIKRTVLAAASDSPRSKNELVSEARAKPKLEASVRKVGKAIGKLLKKGKLVQTGARARARFSRR